MITSDLVAGVQNRLHFDEYQKVKRVNWSRLKLLAKSPAHYREELTNPSPDTDPKKRGRAVHAHVFEPERYASDFVVWDDRRAGKEWEKFKAEHEGLGREILTEDMDEDAKQIAKVVRADHVAKRFLERGKSEVTLVWDYKAVPPGSLKPWSIPCKGRPDFITNDGVFVDLKTTRDGSVAGFGREVARYSYHAQAAFYADGYRFATGKSASYVFVAVESVPPYAVTVFKVPDQVLELGRALYAGYMQQLHHCQEENEWPAYATEPVDLVLPHWAVPDTDDETGLGLVIGGEG